MRGGFGFLATALGAVLLLGACGDDDDDDGGGPETVTITAIDYAYEGVPERVAVGSTLVLRNASAGEVHEIVGFHIPDGVDLSLEDLLALPGDEFEELVPPGLSDSVIVALPGEDGILAVGDGILAEPGRYAIVCFIPTGADPDIYRAAMESESEGPPDGGDGAPHFVQGMLAELTVE